LATTFILEGWRNLLHDYQAVRHLGRTILIIVGLLLLAIVALTAPYGISQDQHVSAIFIKAVNTGLRSARFLLVGIIVAFFVFTSYFALGWKHFQFGILLGYGLYSAASLACSAYAAKTMGQGLYFSITMIDSTAYILTLVLWLTYLLRREPHTSAQLIPQSAKMDLEHWNDALKGYMNT